METRIDSFSRYIPPDPESSGWGWRILDAGRQSIAPKAPYPGTGHPLGYLFDQNGRRTLDEFQIVLISKGEGIFESNSVPSTPVKAGTALLLFPGEWHRYQPDPTSGWLEYWVGFRGADATRVMHQFFQPQRAVIESTQAHALAQLFDQLLHWIRQPLAGRDQIAASHIPLALAFLRANRNEATLQANTDATLVFRAKAEILKNLSSRTDLEALAQKLGISYSRFRFAFKKQTGHSPREFENRIKLNRSRDLLLQHKTSVSETANKLGYTSVYYFSRAFKKQYGQSPQNWLESQDS